MSSASAAAWSGKSLVDSTQPTKRDIVILNNNLGALHSVAGLDNNQKKGDVVSVLNRGTSPLTLAALDSAAAAKNQFATTLYLGAGSKLQLYYNGLQWEMFSDTAGAIITKMVEFVEDATHTSHVGTVPIPPGAILLGIDVIPQVLWGAGSAAMSVGDTASATGYFNAINLKATDALVGEVFDTNASELWGGKQGAYLVAATGQRGPTASNFGKKYVAGSNIVATITVGTPAVTTGRTTMVVRYCVPPTIAPVVS